MSGGAGHKAVEESISEKKELMRAAHNNDMMWLLISRKFIGDVVVLCGNNIDKREAI